MAIDLRPAQPDGRKQVLYLVHRLPYPPDKGDRIRAFNLLKWLSARAAVHLACLADEPVRDDVVEALAGYCARVAVHRVHGWSRSLRAAGSLLRGRTATEGAFSSPALRQTLSAWTRATSYHVALASASSMVPYLQSKELSPIPAVVDLVDVDSQKWLDYAAASRGPKAWLYRTEGNRLRLLEQLLPSWARAVTLVSEAEADLYRQFCVAGAVQAVANGVDLDYFHPRPQMAADDCVFVGQLDYRPNVDAVCWFCREVWPKVQHRRPQTKVYLVGRRPVPAVRGLAELPGVVVTGEVPDVRTFLAGAAVAVAPLRIARGLQNKVLEALAMGKATVASPQSLAALQVQPGVHVLSAASSHEWAEAILRLLEDADLRQRLGTAGRRYVEEHHHWDRCLEPLGTLLGLSAGSGQLAGVAGGSSRVRSGP
jgi:sugar transferase (PEP-CTERM/EpsH1 system associated)